MDSLGNEDVKVKMFGKEVRLERPKENSAKPSGLFVIMGPKAAQAVREALMKDGVPDPINTGIMYLIGSEEDGYYWALDSNPKGTEK